MHDRDMEVTNSNPGIARISEASQGAMHDPSPRSELSDFELYSFILIIGTKQVTTLAR